jgi:pimeloyl-ACP methyl ester carboxylesterase
MTGPAQRLSSSRLRLATGGFARIDLLVASPMMNASVKPIRVWGWSGVAVINVGATCVASAWHRVSAAIRLVIAARNSATNVWSSSHTAKYRGNSMPAISSGSTPLVATAAGKLSERGLGRVLATPATRLLYSLVQRAPHAAADAAVRVLAGPLCRALTRLEYGDNGTRHDALVALSAAAINATGLATKAGFLRSLQTYDQYQTLGSITAETTILSGGTDKLTPPEHARDLAAGIPNATLVYQRDAGHMLPHETSQLVTDAISGAITRSRVAAAV